MSTTVWIGDKKYAVDEEVRSEIDRLGDEITTMDSTFTALLNEKEQTEADLATAKEENEQLKGEKGIPFAWWKDCPGVAQKTMERTIERNEHLLTINDDLQAENERLRIALEFTFEGIETADRGEGYELNLRSVVADIEQALKGDKP